MKYDYRQAMINDIKNYIIENNWVEKQDKDLSYEELLENLTDELWGEDKITGNGLHGYASEEECQEYIASNLTLYFEAANEFEAFPNSGSPWIYKNPAKYMDATIRCYLLRECVDEACNQL